MARAAQRAKRGLLETPEDFDDLYRRDNGALFRFVLRRVFEPQVALDLTAETFAQAFIGRRRFRGTTEAELRAWLFGIARRQPARYCRRGQAERRAVKRLEIQVPRLTEEEVLEAERLADLDQLRAEVQIALADLSAEHREALRLRVVEERPYPEVARRLGTSEQTARARVSRGLRALGEALEIDNRAQEVPT
jgi:RNA polymerase sigma factor (sigma-70 family)